MKCFNMANDLEICKCKDCVWCISQPNKEGMIHCKLRHYGMYGDSLACIFFERYDPKNRPF